MDYTVIGDAVNTASRLEAIAKQCGQSIVMSAAVAEHLPSNWRGEPGQLSIRGQGQQQVFALKTDTAEVTPRTQICKMNLWSTIGVRVQKVVGYRLRGVSVSCSSGSSSVQQRHEFDDHRWHRSVHRSTTGNG